jgi:hypothetical protein
MKAMGVPDSLGVCTVRLSVGRFTSEADVEKGAAVIAAAVLQRQLEATSDPPAGAGAPSAGAVGILGSAWNGWAVCGALACL